jgi:DNA polymerase-3 subunit alpha
MERSRSVHLRASRHIRCWKALTIARLAEWRRPTIGPHWRSPTRTTCSGALEFSEKLAGYGIQPIVDCARR